MPRHARLGMADRRDEEQVRGVIVSSGRGRGRFAHRDLMWPHVRLRKVEWVPDQYTKLEIISKSPIFVSIISEMLPERTNNKE